MQREEARRDPYDGTRLDGRDPDYIRSYMRCLDVFARYYFRLEARGFERIPKNGPALLVGSHSGGIMAPDVGMTLYAWYRTRSVETPAYGLVHRNAFRLAGWNEHVVKLGGIQAHPWTAMAALQRGGIVLVYPGGGDDVYRTYARRHEIELAGNSAFVRLALRYGAPIYPVVSVGAHETLIVLDDGKELARKLGVENSLERLPLSLSWPFGLTLGPVPNLPFPAQIRLAVGEAVDFEGVGPRDARDPEVIETCYDIVRARLQLLMNELALEAGSAPTPS